MAKLKAVIFDYYETLARLPSEPRERMFDELARKVGMRLEPGEAIRQWRELTTKDATLRLAGQERPPLDGTPPPFVTFRDVWRHRGSELFARWGVEADPELAYTTYRDEHALAPLYPEIVTALESLRGRYRLAVLSDADDEFLLPNIERHGLDFDAVVSSEEVRAYKPHVSLFREALRRLGVAPHEAAYVGDTPWSDIAGARHAGLRSIWINRHGAEWPDDLEPPDARIASLEALAGALASGD